MQLLISLRTRWRLAALVATLLVAGTTPAVLVACSDSAKDSAKSAPKPPAGSTLEIPSCAGARLLADGEITELRVTARTATGDPLAGATVLFVAPESTPGGTFEDASKYGPTTARVRTDSDGVAVAVGRPFSRRDDYELWYCSYSVSQGSQILTTGTVAGVDSLQALLLCLGVVRAELDGISARGHVTVPEHLFGSQRGL